MGATFTARLAARVAASDSLLCVGLDPILGRGPLADAGLPTARLADELVRFNRTIIEATVPYACAFKPNLAFYLPLGAEGITALIETRQMIPADIPVILDAKAADIGHTAERYADTYLGRWGFDAVTVNPYLGEDSIAPFLAFADRGVFVLARTSNAGSGDFQDLPVGPGGEPLSDRVAARAVAWDCDHAGSVGLVVGATYPAELARIRGIATDLPILLPGIGAQGGDVAAAVRAGQDAAGAGLLVSSGRAIMYASEGDGAAAGAAEAASALRDEINRSRVTAGRPQ